MGPTTTLGEFDLAAANGAKTAGEVTGGTVVVQAGGGTLTSTPSNSSGFTDLAFEKLTIKSDNPTLTLVNINLLNDTVQGARTLVIDNPPILGVSSAYRGTEIANTTLMGVSDIAVTGYYGLFLDNVTFAGITGGPTITGGANVSANQSVEGWTIDGGVGLSGGGTYSGATFDIAYLSNSGTVAATIGATSNVIIQDGGFLNVSALYGGAIINQATIASQGDAQTVP